MNCASCQQKTGDSFSTDSFMVPNTGARLCRQCERAWLLSPESLRLRAISLSVFSEWVERLRCEALTEKQRQEGVVG